jgi:putative addiction module killer protein
MLIRVEEYQRIDGSSPFRHWFDRLSAQPAAKVATALLRVANGNTSSIKWFAGIGEIRIDWGPGYRVYLARTGESLIVLFGGGTKASQSRDIARVLELLGEYKARKRSAGRSGHSGRKR